MLPCGGTCRLIGLGSARNKEIGLGSMGSKSFMESFCLLTTIGQFFRSKIIWSRAKGQLMSKLRSFQIPNKEWFEWEWRVICRLYWTFKVESTFMILWCLMMLITSQRRLKNNCNDRHNANMVWTSLWLVRQGKQGCYQQSNIVDAQWKPVWSD